jgi:hypothetical protein
MKKNSVLFLAAIMILLLSSCSMHLGLRKLLNGGSSQPTKAKHVKATHTPPSPPTATPASMGAPVLAVSVEHTITIAGTADPLDRLQAKMSSAVIIPTTPLRL